jgi:hypothetical protein
MAFPSHKTILIFFKACIFTFCAPYDTYETYNFKLILINLPCPDFHSTYFMLIFYFVFIALCSKCLHRFCRKRLHTHMEENSKAVGFIYWVYLKNTGTALWQLFIIDTFLKFF